MHHLRRCSSVMHHLGRYSSGLYHVSRCNRAFISFLFVYAAQILTLPGTFARIRQRAVMEVVPPADHKQAQ